MQVKDLVNNYLQTKAISENDIEQIRIDRELRSDLCKYFGTVKNREFALELWNTVIELRKNPEKEILIDDLMLACYILGLHQQVADCRLIWKAKNVDFDAFCGVDVQLMAFAGAAPAISYLQTTNGDDVKAALKYMIDCSNAGDFDNLEDYFSLDNLPWWV
ncbi:MAG TPA: hypothetical protein VHD83_21615 [Puia sp.]|nr:hypothetical protein [Puia sp.]